MKVVSFQRVIDTRRINTFYWQFKTIFLSVESIKNLSKKKTPKNN